MKLLTAEQQQSLVEIIKDEFGDELLLEDFTDVLSGMLEDISGFETSSQQALNKLTNQLWSQYHE